MQEPEAEADTPIVQSSEQISVSGIISIFIVRLELHLLSFTTPDKTTLSGMNIFNSQEAKVEDAMPIAKSDEMQIAEEVPIEAPVSPSRGLAQSTEEISKSEKVFVPPKLSQSGYVSSPALLTKPKESKKRKNTMKQELYLHTSFIPV